MNILSFYELRTWTIKEEEAVSKPKVFIYCDKFGFAINLVLKLTVYG